MKSDLTKRVTEKLDELVDDETMRRFGELNIVTDVSEASGGSMRIKFRPLAAYSPLAVGIGQRIRDTVLSVDGVKAVRVECYGHLMDELVNRIVNKDDMKPQKPK